MQRRTDAEARRPREPLRREIFRSGEYVRYFRPEDRGNPFRRIYRRKKEDALALIARGKAPRRILDAGGGMGRLSGPLAEDPANRVTLLDISMEMLSRAAADPAGRGRVLAVNADAHRLPFGDGCFDIVVGLDLFCHLSEPDRALREFHRVLEAGGHLLLDSTNSVPLWALFYPRYLGKNPRTWWHVLRFHGHLPGWERIVTHYRKDRFLALLRGAGFEVLETRGYGPLPCPKWHLALGRKKEGTGGS